MRDYDELSFATKEEAHEFFKGQEQTDKWVRIYTNEIDAIPLENVGVQMYRDAVMPLSGRKMNYNSSQIAKDVTDDDLVTSMENSKLMAAIPVDDKLTVYPLRFTAFPLIQARAGVGGSSISNLRDRGAHREMAAQDRAFCINKGLELYKDKTLVLIRDGKITAMMSGDENDYSVLPINRLINALENELADQFADYEYVSCVTSHEITSIVYKLNDADLETRIANMLQVNGITPGEIKVAVRLSSSDVGLCEARVTPIVQMDGVQVAIGQPEDLKHANGASIAKFCDLCHSVLIAYKDNAKNIQKLMDIKIEYPSNCFKNVVKKLGLSGYAQFIPQMMERIEDEHSLECTAFDIYWYLNELLYTKESSTVSDKSDAFLSIKAQETVAKVLKMDIKEYDTI